MARNRLPLQRRRGAWVLRSKRIAWVSLLSGALAVALASLAVHLRSVRIPGSFKILSWLDSLGLVKQPAREAPHAIVIELPLRGIPGAASERTASMGGVSEMTDAGYFAINDENAILLLFASSIALALAAMLVAIWAEYRKEPTLYLSVGYICGVLAIAQVWLPGGFVCGFVGMAALLVLRHQREP